MSIEAEIAERWIGNEIPEVDETGRIVTLAKTPNPPEFLMLHNNGVLQYQGEHYELHGNKAMFRFSVRTPSFDPKKSLRAFYRY